MEEFEQELFEALWKLADRFGWELTKREGADDPDYGRDDLKSDVWPYQPTRCSHCLSDEHTTTDHNNALFKRIATEARLGL